MPDPQAGPSEDSKPFEYSCPCLNVRITGKVATSASIPSSSKVQAGSSEVTVWLDQDSEQIKQTRYVTWDQEDSRPSRRKSLAPDEASTGQGPSWRKCWICNVKLYQFNGKTQDNPRVVDDWVTIDLLGGILWGDQLQTSQTLLPFTSLHLDIHPYISKFGKPPPSPLTVYQPTRSGLPGETSRYIRPPADPFFLPPPFIPSHPHLRELCTRAVDFLRDRHSIKEYQIQQFITQQEQEMRDLEDTVRNEVEALWNRYTHVPGVAAELDRSRSRSTTRDAEDPRQQSVSKFSPSAIGDSTPTQTPNPIKGNTPASPVVGSLLSASINANTFHAPPPPRVSDRIDDSILQLSKTTDKSSDARAVAMSHVFSVLDDHMASKSGRKPKEEAKTKPKDDSNRLDEIAEGSDTNGKDSWIVQEEKALAGTSKPFRRQELDTEKGKEKRAVKFVDAESESSARDDDHVFEFELEETHPAKPTSPTRDIPRTRNEYEASLSRTYAADAPSHRHGWKRALQDGSLYAPMRRTSTDSIGEDESTISKLAMSMPMGIALKAQRKPCVPPMERKTSWSDRPELVPPLLGAMRQRGLETPNSLGLSPARPTRGEVPRKTSRSASVSRERDQARTYSQDPGAIFESLADAVEDDDDGEDEEGTFVPPHVLAGRNSQDGGPEIGWRSLAPS